MATKSDPALAAALQEADRFGWLLYADKQALGAGNTAEVVARLAQRARSRRRGLIVGLGWVVLQVPFALISLGDHRHGLLGPITGWVLLAMLLAFTLFVFPRLWRMNARIERELGPYLKGLHP